MAVTIADVMRACRNFFVFAYTDDEYTVKDGAFPYDHAPDGCYVAVTGSLMNDCVTTVQGGQISTGGADEVFKGRVYILHPPKDFIDLCAEIAAYDAKQGASDIVTESFGNYSSTRATVNGAPVGWMGAFSSRLLPYRRMFSEVRL